MLRELAIKLITLLHVLFIVFVLVTPFTWSNYFLLLHVITMPFIVIHWLANNNICALTLIERKLRGKSSNDKDCFTCRLIEPVYDVHKNYKTYSCFIYILVTSLWLISVGKLFWEYQMGNLDSIDKVFRI